VAGNADITGTQHHYTHDQHQVPRCFIA